VPLRIGDKAPLFSLKSQSGQVIELKNFVSKKAVVVYFYPKDDTPGCTKEACTFRDQYEVFRESGAEVLGISSDSTESHKKFAESYRLPFHLLSDKDGIVRKLYQVPSTFGLLPGRVTFVIDKSGIIRHIFSSQFNALQHVNEALKALGTIPAIS
jgi:peroxiredoxin Q/BCP